ncbi:hypothetical protein QYF36_003921 [Acer negundo]|nr:hypothetical protein QYF36_003921 [Acer negundo]
MKSSRACKGSSFRLAKINNGTWQAGCNEGRRNLDTFNPPSLAASIIASLCGEEEEVDGLVSIFLANYKAKKGKKIEGKSPTSLIPLPTFRIRHLNRPMFSKEEMNKDVGLEAFVRNEVICLSCLVASDIVTSHATFKNALNASGGKNSHIDLPHTFGGRPSILATEASSTEWRPPSTGKLLATQSNGITLFEDAGYSRKIVLLGTLI